MADYKDKYGVVFSADRKTLKTYTKALQGEYIIPDGVTKIGYHAFAGCAALTSITIPSSVISIDGSAFYECTSLVSIVVAKDNLVYDSREGCNAIIRKASNTLIIGCKSTIIPSSVTKIGQYAFEDCVALTSIIIPKRVTTIGQCAFSGCAALTSVIIPESVKEIDRNAFAGCTALTSITIPGSVKEIGDYAFAGCKALSDIAISGRGTTIGDHAFYWCVALSSITIPESVTKIGEEAFAGCANLTSVRIPDSVTTIGNSAFYGCTALTSITIPKGVTKIGDWAFAGCKALSDITIPESVTTIGKCAFNGCPATILVNDSKIYTDEYGVQFSQSPNRITLQYFPTALQGEYTIPEGVTEIGKEAFRGCAALTSITIPDNVTKIGAGAFSRCTSLTSITIPDSVTEIGWNAFSGCPNLTAVWHNILLLAANHGPIPDGVTTIGESALEKTRRTIISLPPSVTTIEREAFRNAEALSILILPPSVKSIVKDALNGCQQLKMLQAPACAIKCLSGTGSHDTAVVIRNTKPASLLKRAFAKISCVGSVTLTDTVSGIGDEAFVLCSGLRALAISASVKKMGSRLFASNPLLETIRLEWTDRLPDADLGEIDYSRVRLIVPAGTTALYRASATWGRFTHIEEA